MSGSGGRAADVVAELARRFQAGDGAAASGLYHPEIRIGDSESEDTSRPRRPAIEATLRL